MEPSHVALVAIALLGVGLVSRRLQNTILTLPMGEALRGGWSVRQLDRQIGSKFYGRTLLSKNKAAMLENNSRAVTITEIIKGFQRVGRDDRAQQFLTAMGAEEVLSLDREAAVIAGRIYGELERTGQTTGRADPMIAGIAIHHRLALVSGRALAAGLCGSNRRLAPNATHFGTAVPRL